MDDSDRMEQPVLGRKGEAASHIWFIFQAFLFFSPHEVYTGFIVHFV